MTTAYDLPEEAMRSGPDPDRFRRALGHFCTGVTVVTSMDGEKPVGFACQAFAALSLDPPLVLFCPSKSSRTWPAIQKAGVFCINVLSASQQDVSRAFGTPGADKFAGLSWTLSPNGAPVLDGVMSWIDCRIDTVHEAGDHYVVIGHVTELEDSGEDDRPLLYFKGDYNELVASAGPAGPEPPHELVETVLSWPHQADWM